MKLLFLDIAARNLVFGLDELNVSLLLSKINVNLILTITSSIDWNKEVDSTRTESVMLTETTKKMFFMVTSFINEIKCFSVQLMHSIILNR